MSKDLKKKALAFGSMLGLALSGVVAMPASAAIEGDVTQYPMVGLNQGTFQGSPFLTVTELSRAAENYQNDIEDENFAYEIINEDQTPLIVSIEEGDVDSEGYFTTDNTQDYFDIWAFDDRGRLVAYVEDLDVELWAQEQEFVDDEWVDYNSDDYDDTSVFMIDFAAVNATRVVIRPTDEYVYEGSSISVTPAERPDNDTLDEFTDLVTTDFREFGETAHTAGGEDGIFSAGDFTARPSDEDDLEEWLDGFWAFPVAFGDVLWESDAGTGYRSVVDSDGINAEDLALGYGDGDTSIKLRSWIETQAVYNFATVDTRFVSAQDTITWYDPAGVVATSRPTQAVFAPGSALADSNDPVALEVSFNKPINLDMAAFGKFVKELDIESWYDSDGDTALDGWNVSYFLNGTKVGSRDDDLGMYWDEMEEMFPGIPYNASENEYQFDDFGKLYVLTAPVASGTLVRAEIQHSGLATAPKYSSTSYLTPSVSAPAVGAAVVDGYTVTVNNGTSNTQVDEDDRDFMLKTGVNSYTYTFQLMDGDVAVKRSGVPVAVVVENYNYNEDEAYLSTDSVITVTGSRDSIRLEGTAVVSSGVTNANGQYSVTVNHSGAKATDAYTLSFNYLTNGGDGSADVFVDDFEPMVAEGPVTVEYEAALPQALEANTEVISAADASVTFSVEDQFGAAVSTLGTTALTVELKSSDQKKVDLKGTVTNGSVSFSFKNYLTNAAVDTLSATLKAGTRTLGTVVVTLYAPIAVSAVEVSNPRTYVSYGDFFTGKPVADSIVPADADSAELAGRIIDKDGYGLPGGLVTIKAAGVQFLNTTTGVYSIGEATVVTNVDGQFAVDVWTKTASSAGQDVTITAGGVTKTVKLISYLPTGLTGANLAFSWTLPAQVVKNTTYAVTLKLTDKWGNPVNANDTEANGRAVKVEAAGSLEVNGENEVCRNFGTDGTVTVFIRSVKDIAGPASLSATLDADADYSTASLAGVAGTGSFGSLGVQTQNLDTAWDETKWSNELETDIQVLDAPSGKVNVGSFNGKLVVYASGLQGSTISWKVGGVWGKAVATSNYSVFDRPTPRRGVTVTVDIYVNGVKQLTKSVVTR